MRQEGLHGPICGKLGDPLAQHLDGFRVLAQGPVSAAQTEERATLLLVGQVAGDGLHVIRHGFPLVALEIVQPRHLVVGLGVVGSLCQNAREQRPRRLEVSALPQPDRRLQLWPSQVAALLLFEQLPEHRLQDAAVPQVLDLDRGVHTRLDRELLLLAVVRCDLDGQLLAGF